MRYPLKDEVNLTRHVASQSGVRRYRLPIGTPLGRHLPTSTGFESRSFDVQGVTFNDHVKRLDDLMKRVQTNEDSETVDEVAWSEVTVRLEAMAKIAKEKDAELVLERRQAKKEAKVDRHAIAVPTMRLKKTSKVAEVGKEWAHEGAAHSLALYGVNVAASAISLLGAQQSEHFAEAFNHILENPGFEVGVTTGLALLISALVARIRKSLRARKDRKIAAARSATSA